MVADDNVGAEVDGGVREEALVLREMERLLVVTPVEARDNDISTRAGCDDTAFQLVQVFLQRHGVTNRVRAWCPQVRQLLHVVVVAPHGSEPWPVLPGL